MFVCISSVSLTGIIGSTVAVEVDIANGLPAFTIVGLPDLAIQESRERIRSAIRNSHFAFPSTRITVNLAPALVRKHGSFDLPIAVGILHREHGFDEEILKTSLFLGELALDGAVRPVPAVLPSVIYARSAGYRRIFIPAENSDEASLIPDIEIIPVPNLRSIVAMLTGGQAITPITPRPLEDFRRGTDDRVDFASVLGQSAAKRALLISACGGHNTLLMGPPGSGKTMLARAYAGILPDMSLDEIIEVSKIYSVAGLLTPDQPLIFDRPYRRVHHTASVASVIGGGRDSRPGEISLAHRGALFLDEFLEFDGRMLETLRQPLEDGEITINRVNASCSYPARFTLIGAMNPCPCGYYGDSDKKCTCSVAQIERYRAKLSWPILDRIDLLIRVPRIRPEELDRAKSWPSSADIRATVERARAIQTERFAGGACTCNGEMTNEDIDRHCPLGADEDTFVREAVARLDLSTRVYFRILRLARTIADIEGSEAITVAHLREAVGYRGSF